MLQHRHQEFAKSAGWTMETRQAVTISGENVRIETYHASHFDSDNIRQFQELAHKPADGMILHAPVRREGEKMIAVFRQKKGKSNLFR